MRKGFTRQMLLPERAHPHLHNPGNDDAGPELQSKRDRNEMLKDFIVAYQYLKNHKDCNDKVGVVSAELAWNRTIDFFREKLM